MASHRNRINMSVKNKIDEHHKFLADHNKYNAIIIESWLISKDIIKVSGYKTYRQDGSNHQKHARRRNTDSCTQGQRNRRHTQPTPYNKDSNTQGQNSPQANQWNGIASHVKINNADLDIIIPPHASGHYIISGDFNAKHHLVRHE